MILRGRASGLLRGSSVRAMGPLCLFLVLAGCARREDPHRESVSASAAGDSVRRPASAQSDSRRPEAVGVLLKAYSEYRLGRLAEAMADVDKALALDQSLAYANIVKGEIAMKAEDWETARVHFERGLEHLREPGQPISPADSVKITVEEVEGDARCFLGYVYIKLAQAAHDDGKADLEQEYLGLAKSSLETGLSLRPGPEARAIGTKLAGMFR
jgi:tetratricopeptide (TPR) repeat protein